MMLQWNVLGLCSLTYVGFAISFVYLNNPDNTTMYFLVSPVRPKMSDVQRFILYLTTNICATNSSKIVLQVLFRKLHAALNVSGNSKSSIL